MNKITKVVFVVTAKSAFKKPIIDYFKKNLIKFRIFDNRKTNILEKFLFALSILIPSFYKIATQSINNRLICLCNSEAPSLVFVSKGENLYPKTIEQIARNAKIVNWFPDYFRKFDQIENWLAQYSLFFTGDNHDVRTYQKKGFTNLRFLPYAGPALLQSQNKKLYNVVFLGSYSKEREILFQKLKKYDIKIWGDRKWSKSNLKDCYVGNWLPIEDMIQILLKSKITVNHHRESEKNNTVLNMRVYEATACSSLVITDYRKDLRKMFRIGNEVVVYTNPSDLEKKVGLYLADDKAREKIARNGYLRLNKDHTYTNRLNVIINSLDEKQSNTGYIRV